MPSGGQHRPGCMGSNFYTQGICELVEESLQAALGGQVGVGRVPTPSARQLSAAGRGQEHSKCSQSWAPQRVASCTRCALGVHGALKGGQHRHPATLKPGLSRCSQWVVTEITPVCFFGLLFKEKDVNALLRSV